MPYFKNPRLYLARPISGCEIKVVMDWYRFNYKCFIDMGFDVAMPLIAEEYMRTDITFKAEGYGTQASSNRAIVDRDFEMAERCDMVLCDLSDATRVSIGSMMEIDRAKIHRAQVILVMKPDNIHNHAFVKETASVVYETMEQAVEYLSNFVQSLRPTKESFPSITAKAREWIETHCSSEKDEILVELDKLEKHAVWSHLDAFIG